jgi:hypothetical protein
VDRDDLKQQLALLEHEIKNGKLYIEKQRLLIEKVTSGLDQSEALKVLTRLLQAQRDLENKRDELMKSINA